MNVVSFETAKRLKEAGFPQPDRFFGQIWYLSHNGRHVLIGSAEGNITDAYDRVFAPTATDILKELGRTWNLHFDKISGREAPPPLWACTCDGISAYGEAQYHENPAEACAAAWLSNYEILTSNLVEQDPDENSPNQ